MKKILFPVLLLLMLTTAALASPPFYILSGGHLTRVENGDASTLKVSSWRVWLYKKGAATTGSSYWGTIEGHTAEDVMQKLKASQDFELSSNAFFGKGRVQDPVFTSFNPLGPIAVVDKSVPIDPASVENQDKIETLSQIAKDYFQTYLDAKKNLDKILRAQPPTPFDNMGATFREYTSLLKDVYTQIDAVRKMSFQNLSDRTAEIENNIKQIDGKMVDVNNRGTALITDINNYNNSVKNNNTNAHASGTTAGASTSNFLTNVPGKYMNSISPIIQSGRNIIQLKASIPDELMAGMTTQQQVYYKSFVEDVYYYWSDMAYCFGYLSPGSIGYNYTANNNILIDQTDQYYRDEVMKNADMLMTDNYNSTYSKAMLEKGNTAYDLYQLLNTDPSVSRQTKNNVLKYGIASVNMIYQQSLPGYTSQDIIKEKQDLLAKLKANIH